MELVEWILPSADCGIRVYPTSSKKLFPLLQSWSIFSGTRIQCQKPVSAAVNVQEQETPRFTFPTSSSLQTVFCAVAEWLAWLLCSSYKDWSFFIITLVFLCCLLAGKLLFCVYFIACWSNYTSHYWKTYAYVQFNGNSNKVCHIRNILSSKFRNEWREK